MKEWEGCDEEIMGGQLAGALKVSLGGRQQHSPVLLQWQLKGNASCFHFLWNVFIFFLLVMKRSPSGMIAEGTFPRSVSKC